MVVFTNVKKEDVAKLIEKGFQTDTPKTIYEEYRLRKNGIILIHYNSGKLLLQGKEDAVEKIVVQLERLKIGKKVQPQQFNKETGWVIGSDEALKGDTFGGLVVAAVKADDKIRKKLLELGVADSKKLQDKEIFNLAEQIKKIAPCEIRNLLPEEYNQDGHVTQILNRLHRQSAHGLAPGKHIVDKYPGCAVGDVRIEKAEDKYVEVAAASILARSAGLQQLNQLSIQAGFTLPKGSTHVREALQQLKEKSLDFNKFVKVSFNNVRELL